MGARFPKPFNTLQLRSVLLYLYSKAIWHSTKHQAAQKLNPYQERRLCTWATQISVASNPRIGDRLRDMATRIMRARNPHALNLCLSKRWLNLFLKRNSHISRYLARKIDISWYGGLRLTDIGEYFK